MPPAVPEAVLVDDVGYRMGPRYEAGTYDAASLSRGLSASLSRRVMGRADEALLANSHRDPAHPKWAIVPHAGACGYCVMLGSLGFNYNSEGTANVSRHSKCTCSVVVDFDADNPALEGYDPGRLYESYRDARATALPDADRRWAAMSKAERESYRRKLETQWGSKDHYTMSAAEDHFRQRAIVEELNRRDRGWLQSGKPAGVAYENDQVKARLAPWEVRTGERLNGLGYPVRFVKDTEEYYVGKQKLTMGLPDLENGFELKTITTSKSINTVKSHLSSASKKKGLSMVVFDNSEAVNMTDEMLVGFLRRSMGAYGVEQVLMIGHDGLPVIIGK